MSNDCDVCRVCASHELDEPTTAYMHRLVDANHTIMDIIAEADGEGIDLCTDEIEAMMEEIFPGSDAATLN